MERSAKSIVRTIMIAMSFLCILLGGCGLDSENILTPIIIILLGMFFGMCAMLSENKDENEK